MKKDKIPKTKKVKRCLLCKYESLKKIFSLGNLYVSNFVNKNEVYNGIKAPLTLMYCRKCTMIQLSHIAPQEIMYKKFYWYRSSVTKTKREALKDIYKSSLKYAKLNKNDVILDIGANDGTLLKYYNKKYTTIGCEPAKNLKNDLKKNCNYILNDFWSYENFNYLLRKKKLKKPKIITAIGMFYDLEDPNKFIKDSAQALDRNGIFIAQLMCLKSMIEKNDLGNICHEHNINGGSYRIYCRKYKNGSIKLKEKNVLNSVRKFFYNIKKNKRITMGFINKKIKKGKKIFLYGASTKGNTLLQFYKINNKIIPCAAERSPEKWNKYTIGTGIKIISEKEARKLNPDYYLVTPWGFIKEFVKRESAWMKKGGKFILPFPKFKLIK